jgi:hypothetical protein
MNEPLATLLFLLKFKDEKLAKKIKKPIMQMNAKEEVQSQKMKKNSQLHFQIIN